MRNRTGTRPSRSRRSPGSRSSGSGSTVRSGWPRAGGRPGRPRREEDAMRHVTLAMLATFAVLAAALGAPGAQSPQKVVFALNWFAVGDHAAYWVALEKGYYRARGLEVELQNSKGSGDSIAKVDTGRADIGLADAAVVIPRIAQGARVKIVGAVFDNTPLNMWMCKSSAIATPGCGSRAPSRRGRISRARRLPRPPATPSASSSRRSPSSTASTRPRSRG